MNKARTVTEGMSSGPPHGNVVRASTEGGFSGRQPSQSAVMSVGEPAPPRLSPVDSSCQAASEELMPSRRYSFASTTEVPAKHAIALRIPNGPGSFELKKGAETGDIGEELTIRLVVGICMRPVSYTHLTLPTKRIV